MSQKQNQKRIKSIRKVNDKRNKLQLYYDTCNAVKKELEFGPNITYTRVQLSIGTSYDKMMEYLEDLAKYGLILTNPFEITPRGEAFLNRYEMVRQKAEQIEIDFFSNHSSDDSKTRVDRLSSNQ
mgnify:CR=1 FL=1